MRDDKSVDINKREKDGGMEKRRDGGMRRVL